MVSEAQAARLAFNLGLLQSDCSALRQCKILDYDARGENTSVTSNDGDEEGRFSAFDPNGNLIGITEKGVGTESYAYDADNRLTQTVEPAPSGQSPVTLTNHYYGDGKRSQLDASSTMLTQSGLYEYSCRADGKLQTHAVNASFDSLVGSFTIARTYSPGGRPQQRVDSGSQIGTATTNYTFDPTAGYLTTIAYPGGSYENAEYDPEGSMLGYVSSIGPITVALTYSTRGELVTTSTRSELVTAPSTQSYYANGTALTTAPVSQAEMALKGSIAMSWSWDTAMGVLMRTASTTVKGGLEYCGSFSDSATSWSFDAAGRETGSAGNADFTNECPAKTARSPIPP